MENLDNDMFSFGKDNFDKQNSSNSFNQSLDDSASVVRNSNSQYFGSPLMGVDNNKISSNFFESNSISNEITDQNDLFKQTSAYKYNIETQDSSYNNNYSNNKEAESIVETESDNGFSIPKELIDSADSEYNENTFNNIPNPFEQPFGVEEDNKNENIVETANIVDEEPILETQEEVITELEEKVEEPILETQEEVVTELEEKVEEPTLETQEEVVTELEENVETTERTGVITMSDTSTEELNKLTEYQEPENVESTDIKALFDRVGINVKEASDIFRKNTEMKEKLDTRFEELKKLQSEIQKSKKIQNEEIDMYKNSVLEKLNDKKEEIEKRLNKLKEYQSTLEKEKETFEAYKRAEKAEIAKVQREVQEAYDVRREELNHIEDVLRKQKDALDEERNQLSLDRIQYEADKNELANNLLKFNEIVDSFTNGMDKIGKE